MVPGDFAPRPDEIRRQGGYTVRDEGPAAADLPEQIDKIGTVFIGLEFGGWVAEPLIPLTTGFPVAIRRVIFYVVLDFGTEGGAEGGVKFAILLAASDTCWKIQPSASRISIAVFMVSFGTSPL